MKKLLICLFLLSLSTVVYAEGHLVTYKVNGEEFEGYYISPKDNAPLVFMIHDWDGLTDYEIKRSQMLAEAGYAVFAADMFGKGVRPTEIEGKKQLTGALYQNRDRMRALLEGGFAAAKAQGANVENAVAMGYCFGGAVVLEFARSGKDLKGFVTFHGGLTTPQGQNHSQTKGKLLILHGSADTSVTMDDFAKLARELEQYKVNHEMITYSGAPHAFSVFGSDRYRKDADEKSWRRFLEYLEETLD